MHALRLIQAIWRSLSDKASAANRNEAVIPAKAGIQCKSQCGHVTYRACRSRKHGVGYWIPAFAGMTCQAGRGDLHPLCPYLRTDGK